VNGHRSWHRQYLKATVFQIAAQTDAIDLASVSSRREMSLNHRKMKIEKEFISRFCGGFKLSLHFFFLFLFFHFSFFFG
jgi:hypothetical protein